MFGKKKEKKEKMKEEKKKEKSAKEHKKKIKTSEVSSDLKQSDMNGYMWGSQSQYPQAMPNGYGRDQMGEAIYIQKPNSVIEGHDATAGPKYGAKNLKLVSEKDGKKDKKDKGKSGGILKTTKDTSGFNGQSMMHFEPAPKPAPQQVTNSGQVTFAGPDNRVHQSVVKISQTSSSKPPDILPNNYQTNAPNAQPPNGYLAPIYPAPVNGSVPMMQTQNLRMTSPNARMTSPYLQAPAGTYSNAPRMTQQYITNRAGMPGQMINGGLANAPQDPRGAFALSNPNIAFNGHAPIRATNSDPTAPMSAAEQVKHLQISQGMAGTRHVTSIDVIGKANPSLVPQQFGYAPDQSPTPLGYSSDRSESPISVEPAQIATAQGGIPQPYSAQNQHNGYSYQNDLPVQHNKGPAPAPPVVLAEINVTENMVPQQKHNEAYAKFDRMVEKAREDEIVYAQLLFNEQNKLNKKPAGDLKREKIANYTIEMDSDEENANPLRIKGILKAPKKVEFNKDVDVTLFGTLSRHESLESLYNDRIHGRDIMAARKKCAPATRYAQPPPYAEIIEERPLDDTDLYMYTMRRRRAPAVYVTRDMYGETLHGISRHDSLRASGSRGRPSVRTVRVLPSKHKMW